MADFNQIEPSRHPSILAVGPRDDVPTVLQGLDFFVLSSVGEGFPNVVVEAMASGVPCIVTDVGDTAEIVGDTGWIVPASDPRALAQAMRLALAEDEAARHARSDAARARISEMYTIRKMVQSYENLWHQVRSFESGTSHKKFNLENRK
jgi:glycosyltransferase involved in cell wall biosynthesis